ncbi:hypothetical protein CMS34_22900 [Salmonella enterica]|nr:hypothetical protein [Salmonella enterica]
MNTEQKEITLEALSDTAENYRELLGYAVLNLLNEDTELTTEERERHFMNQAVKFHYLHQLLTAGYRELSTRNTTE